jgi:4a-hydroxytetrahydrobiopterin dehydratase
MTDSSIPAACPRPETSAENTTETLRTKRCVPCEGGVPKLTAAEADSHLQLVSGWKLAHDGERIRKEWTVKHFRAGMEFFERVSQLAEDEGHHPDLHLVGYRNLAIEIWTHAIGGLSENDFILAAKIDQLPIQLKSSPTAAAPTAAAGG